MLPTTTATPSTTTTNTINTNCPPIDYLALNYIYLNSKGNTSLYHGKLVQSYIRYTKLQININSMIRTWGLPLRCKFSSLGVLIRWTLISVTCSFSSCSDSDFWIAWHLLYTVPLVIFILPLTISGCASKEGATPDSATARSWISPPAVIRTNKFTNSTKCVIHNYHFWKDSYHINNNLTNSGA